MRYYGEAKVKQIGCKKITPTEKLMSFLKPVENYCCTDNLLRHLIESGHILNDVTKLVELKSKDYVREHVIENQDLHMRTNCIVEKKLRKDMNNTLYGNYCMNLEKHMIQAMIYDDVASVCNVVKMCN